MTAPGNVKGRAKTLWTCHYFMGRGLKYLRGTSFTPKKRRGVGGRKDQAMQKGQEEAQKRFQMVLT